MTGKRPFLTLIRVYSSGPTCSGELIVNDESIVDYVRSYDFCEKLN